MTPYIFGIGTGKTGSNSLSWALNELGLECYHGGHQEFHGNGDLHRQILANYKDRCDPLKNVSGVDALVDYPVFHLFKALDESVPDAKFILTYRNPDECALSWCRMVSAQHELNKHWINKKARSYKNYVEFVREHNDQVIEHFFGRPEKLLILDIKDDDRTKWRLLCRFLKKELPDRVADNGFEYPRVFDHKHWETKDEE